MYNFIGMSLFVHKTKKSGCIKTLYSTSECWGIIKENSRYIMKWITKQKF